MLCVGPEGGGWYRSAEAAKELEKYGFETWFCVTLFKEHGVHQFLFHSGTFYC